MTDYDSPWKEALAVFFQDFMAYFFPLAGAAIDWSRSYEVLDQELQQVIREADMGPRRVDLLVRVWLKDGQEEWILTHVEVQSQHDVDFAQRMFVYNYRLFDRYNQMAVSLAILGDDRPGWRPSSFEYYRWGCSLGFRFPVVKLLDYADQAARLEQDANPFALLVLAHLKTLETQQDAAQRRTWKFRLIRGLYERGFTQEQVRHLFRVLDWMMSLPAEQSRLFWREFQLYEREKQMPYIPREEQLKHIWKWETLIEAIEAILDVRFGSTGLEVMPAIRRVDDLDTLRTIHRAAPTVASAEDLFRLIPADQPQQ
jgi:hypothetical protein